MEKNAKSCLCLILLKLTFGKFHTRVMFPRCLDLLSIPFGFRHNPGFAEYSTTRGSPNRSVDRLVSYYGRGKFSWQTLVITRPLYFRTQRPLYANVPYYRYRRETRTISVFLHVCREHMKRHIVRQIAVDCLENPRSAEIIWNSGLERRKRERETERGRKKESRFTISLN